MERIDGRRLDEIRETKITVGFQSFAEGSALIEMGQTKVICSASIEERVPPWLRGEGSGWVTAEYGMLPRATLSRSARETSGGSVRGRSQEIQRLLGRTLRAVADLRALGARTVILDCDVIQADAGTRSAAVTGSYVALYQALLGLVRNNVLRSVPLNCAVAAISVGMIQGELLLDLCYEEDFRAEVDANIAMTDRGDLVEVQATGERGPFRKGFMEEATCLAQQGIQNLIELQKEAIQSLKTA